MSEKVKDLMNRLSHPQTIMAIVSAVVLILQNLGIAVDGEKINNIVGLVCYILLATAVLNNPKGKGSYVPFVTSPKLPDINKLIDTVSTQDTAIIIPDKEEDTKVTVGSKQEESAVKEK